MRLSFLHLVVGLPLVFAALFAAARVTAQEPPKDNPKPRVQNTPSAGAQKEITRVGRELQGLWNLTELDWPLLNSSSIESRGYALVSGDHMSLEIHIAIYGPDKRAQNAMLDTGLWRFELEEGSRLSLEAVIGSYLNSSNHIMFREPGVRHRYRVTLVGDRWTLTHEDGQKMVFQRVPDTNQVQRDAFGRPIKEKPDGEKQGGTRKDDVPKSEAPKSDGGKD